jgi:hypothetical protein
VKYSGCGGRCVVLEGNTMSKSFAILSFLVCLAVFVAAPTYAFAQVCNPALAAGYDYHCPRANGTLDLTTVASHISAETTASAMMTVSTEVKALTTMEA